MWGDLVSIFINKSRGIAALISIATIVALAVMIGRSRLGKSLRAAADNPEAATYMGIDVDHAHRIAFALGVGVTAIAGGLLATFTVSPALAAVLLPEKVSETETLIVRGLRRFYRRVIASVLARRGVALAPFCDLIYD